MKIRHLKLSDSDILATLHLQNLPGLSSALGMDTVLRMYRLMLENPQFHLVLGAFEGTRLAGAAAASSNPPVTLRMIKPQITAKFIIQVFLGIITGNIKTSEILSRLRFEKIINSYVSDSHSYIISVMVDKKFRRRGIASELLNNIKSHASRPVWVDTKKTNLPALRLYQRSGFQILAEKNQNVLLKFPEK